MAKAQSSVRYGEWAFLLGVILALIVGLFSSQLEEAGAALYVTGVLAILGLVVGLLNIKEKEVNSFLIAAIALLLVANSWGPITTMLSEVAGDLGITLTIWFTRFFGALAAFVAPAALILSLKAIYNLATS